MRDRERPGPSENQARMILDCLWLKVFLVTLFYVLVMFFSVFFYVFTFPIAPRTIIRERCLFYNLFCKS